MKFCVYDIETIPSSTLPEGIKPEFDPESVKLGNTKDAQKVVEKIDKAKAEFDQSLDKKMSLDPDLCEVVCFVGYHNSIYWIGHPDDGYKVIENAWRFIQGCYLEHIPLVSFNGIAFDLPVLWHQAMKLNIPVSPQMYYDLTKRYDNRYHYDLMEILAGWDKSKWKSLDFYLKLFGIGEKTGDGSEIYGWWQAGLYENIREHCEQDVKLTAKLFERLQNYIVREDRHDSPF